MSEDGFYISVIIPTYNRCDILEKCLAALHAQTLPAARFDGKGWIEAADAGALNLTEAVTLAAWVRPGELSQAGARIIDKSQAGTSNGYLLDTFPGNSLRMITEPNTLLHPAELPAGKWTHVAAVFGASAGGQVLYVDGKPLANHAMGTGAASLSPPIDGRLGLAEGSESAMSAQSLSGIPCWATLGNERFGIVTIPDSVTELHLFIDADKGGELALSRARKAYARPGRTILSHCPGQPGNDWNDELLNAQA